MAAMTHLVAILSLLLTMHEAVDGFTFNLLWCPNTYPTDTTMTAAQAQDRLTALGPMKLVLVDGANADTARSCSVLDLDMTAETYTFSYTENGVGQTKQGIAEFTSGPPTSIVLRGIGNKVLGGEYDGDTKLYIMSVDESELVVLNCFNRFVFHLEYLYVFSNKYESSNLSQDCSVNTVKELFGVTTILQQETC